MRKCSGNKSVVVRPAARTLAVVAAVLLQTASAAEAAGGSNLAKEVLAMTGARTRIVWMHNVGTAAGNKWDAITAEYELMGFDTDEGKARVILPGPASFANCNIAPDGNQVLFTDMTTNMIYAVDWDGKNKRKLVKGYVLHPWKDPKTGLSWFYAGNTYSAEEVHRYRLDDPSIRELAFKRAAHTFTVSADGTHAGSEFPWPNAGVAILPNGSWKQYGSGCNGCIAPDNSFRFFHMGESVGHQGVMMYDAGGANKRQVWFKNIPGMEREHSWIPRWSTDVRFLTLNCPIGGDKAEIYLGQFDEEFTKVVRWIKITDQPGHDTKAYCWIARGLGSFSGEAPLAVEVPPGLAPKGKWLWDYGDGTRETSSKGAHTYTKPGSYTITARRGDVSIRGRVTVYDRKAPRVTAARLLDDTHVLITFDEPVRLKNAKVALSHGPDLAPTAAAKSLKLDGEGIELAIELDAAVREGDVLIFDGIYDRALEPNALDKKPVVITLPPWPRDRRKLVFLWETSYASNIYFDRAADAFRPVSLRTIGMVRSNRYGAMLFEGGAAATPNTGGAIFRTCTTADQLGIEATITPAAAQQGDLMAPTRIITCSTYRRGKEQVNFALHQEEDLLALYIRNGTSASGKPGKLQRVRLCTLPQDTPSHIVVSYAPGDLACYLNGRQVKQTDEVEGKLNWGREPNGERIHFGGAAKGSVVREAWKGALEGIVIYGRTITAEKARKDYDEYAKRFLDRKPVEQLRVRAKLVARSNVPNAADIAPYHSALVVCEYEIEEMLDGTYEPKKIRAAMWGLVHKRKTRLARAKPGDVGELALEKFTDHPELQNEAMQDTLPENFDLTLYVEPAQPEPEPARPTGSARGRLSLAKSYLAAGMKEKAKAIFVEIVQNYPESEHAKDAAKLLEKLKDGK
ncbi:MAG: hypothetical protein HQ592_10800 [Planctomycetes bacterium]|nr:hypothetical protein [Planctomycetota bacterium]